MLIKTRLTKNLKQILVDYRRKAHVVYRNNGLSLTYSEWIKYNRLFNRSSVEDIKTHQIFVAREWKRLLGNTQVDRAIDFGGYAPFWSYMMAFSEAKRKLSISIMTCRQSLIKS